MKCAFGLYDPDEGEVYFNGSQVHFDNPRQGLEAGISMIHQELKPDPQKEYCGKYLGGTDAGEEDRRPLVYRP